MRSCARRVRRVLSTEIKSQLQTALALLSLALAVGCAHATPASDEHRIVSRTRFLMGTTCEITLPARHAAAADAAFDEIARIEAMLSTWRDDSELARANQVPLGTPHVLSSELATLLERTFALSHATGAAFSPLVRPLVDLWKTRAEGALPPRELLASTAEKIGLDAVAISGTTLVRNRDVAIEEGGFGKGYALDRAAAMLRHAGVPEAVIDFGGQLLVVGRPREVAIAHPERRHDVALEIHVADASVSTSSGSEKTFEVDGVRFSHIFDPRTGEALPPRGSVTVVASSATDADVLSTALYVLGPDSGLQWANANGVAAAFLVPSARGYDLVVSDEFRVLAGDARIVDSRIYTSRNE